MVRSGFQTSFILGFVLCLAKGQDTCDGYGHKNDSDFVYGVLRKNITLSCELQSYCERGLWAFRTSPVKYLNAGSCSDCGESFFVSDIIHGDKVNTSLHINNINESPAGIYDCNCQHENVTDRVKCFNLQIEHASCQVELTQNEEVKVFDDHSGSQHDEAIRTVKVNTDDIITARCASDAAQLNTNCKYRSGFLKIKKPKDGCRISCRIESVCEMIIMLSVISSTTNSPSTSTTKEDVTRSNKLTITKSSTVTFATSPYTTDRIISLTSTTRKDEFTRSTKPTMTKTSTVAFATSPYTTEINSSLTYTMSKEEMSTTTMIVVVILGAFIFILIFIVLVLLLKILKGKRKRSAEKEEWINPIYEGFDEGKERDGSTEHEISIIASQPDQETLDDGVYHYVVTSNNKPVHES
ncbi:hypothetical protein BSL78_01749 [Apostichopus japonicus]|uniref:Immunoglobulin subtype domain-containing protein n=1 Tax=Stichopus japonicus TaxID=307972 RepID=A0A2G8LM55_STIJA|nr:hypothetical protein BSL78_01749 [Apostichopus japonicus]